MNGEGRPQAHPSLSVNLAWFRPYPHLGWLVSTFLLSRCSLGEVLLAREWACWALVRWVWSQNLAQLRIQH